MTTFSQTSNNIRNSTEEKLKLFESIRGKDVGDTPFWDAVVITALDENQRDAYEIQLQSKLKRGELPLGVKYHAFYDPPGPKIGNGGSVLVTIGDLLNIYDEKELMKTKVILLPAGGYSQRLPNASVLGKAFTALPIGKLTCKIERSFYFHCTWCPLDTLQAKLCGTEQPSPIIFRAEKRLTALFRLIHGVPQERPVSTHTFPVVGVKTQAKHLPLPYPKFKAKK